MQFFFFIMHWFTSVRTLVERTRIHSAVFETSSIAHAQLHCPGFVHFLKGTYGVEKVPLHWSLKKLCRQFGLPPAQVVFMQAQMHQRLSKVQRIDAVAAGRLLSSKTKCYLIDVREPAELCHPGIPGALSLDETLWEHLLACKRTVPILLYCHFGVRSLDAAAEFSRNGFERVYVIEGGLDAWSTQVDPTIPRYAGHWC